MSYLLLEMPLGMSGPDEAPLWACQKHELRIQRCASCSLHRLLLQPASLDFGGLRDHCVQTILRIMVPRYFRVKLSFLRKPMGNIQDRASQAGYHG